jgi:fatty acid desaturase
MYIVDCRVAPTPWYTAWVTPLINESRDATFVGLMVQCLAFAALGLGFYAVDQINWWLAPVYWAANVALLLDSYTLMLHCTSHRPLFKPKYRLLNECMSWVLGPFFGQTPNTYFAHHLGMHHVEENLGRDLSSTIRFQRDSFRHWLSYWARFLTVGLPELVLYMARNKRRRLLTRTLIGEGVYWGALALLMWINPEATLIVFAIPLVLVRTLLMMINWAQHAFVAQDRPDNPYTSTITCINTRYNRRCFNDGYHVGHHHLPRAHWTEYPRHLEDNAPTYAAEGAIVFDGIDYLAIWFFLMTGRWSRLAAAYVRLPGAPARSEAEIIALLQGRMQPIVPAAPARAARLSPAA